MLAAMLLLVPHEAAALVDRSSRITLQRLAAALEPDPVSLAALEPAPGAHDYHLDDLNAHLVRRSSCDWTDVVPAAGSNLDGDAYMSNAHYEALSFDDYKTEVQSKSRGAFPINTTRSRCTMDSGSGGGGGGDGAGLFFFIDRLGPFSSYGGEDWHIVKWSGLGGPRIPAADRAYLRSSSFLFFSDGDDVPVPHPPLEPHHLHLDTENTTTGAMPGGEFDIMQVRPPHCSCCCAPHTARALARGRRPMPLLRLLVTPTRDCTDLAHRCTRTTPCASAAPRDSDAT